MSVTVYDDSLSTKAIYSAEDTVLRILDEGGVMDFHGSRLDLGGCRVRRHNPAQLPMVRGMVAGLWQARRSDRPAPMLRVSERAYRRAWYSPAAHEIVVPRRQWAWNDLVLCHELAHALAETGHDQRSSHGKVWRREYCALVTDVIGAEAGLILMDALAL